METFMVSIIVRILCLFCPGFVWILALLVLCHVHLATLNEGKHLRLWFWSNRTTGEQEQCLNIVWLQRFCLLLVRSPCHRNNCQWDRFSTPSELLLTLCENSVQPAESIKKFSCILDHSYHIASYNYKLKHCLITCTLCTFLVYPLSHPFKAYTFCKFVLAFDNKGLQSLISSKTKNNDK